MIFRKVDSRIWQDRRLRALPSEEIVEIFRQIAFNEPSDNVLVNLYAGPAYRVRTDDGPRRPDLTTAQWRAVRKRVIERDGGICGYCSEDCSAAPTVDHRVPVSAGGAHYDESNLVTACRRCNSRKGARVPGATA